MRWFHGVSLLLVCTLVTVITGCAAPESDQHLDASAWTVDEERMQLVQDLFISETDDFFFGSIMELDVASDGRMFVLDTQENHVKVLSPDGDLVEVVGRAGEGPGEFRDPIALALGRSDSLFVWDLGNRLSAFDTDSYEYAYTIDVEGPERYQLRSRWMTDSRGFFVPEDEGFLAVFRPHFGEDGPVLVSHIRHDGTVADSALVTTSPGEFLIQEKNGLVAGRARTPFGRAPSFALGPDDRMLVGWSDSLAVSIHDASSGTLEGWHTIPFEPVAVTAAEEEEAVSNLEAYRDMFREVGLAETKPAFDYFLADDRGRVWFKRATPDPERADWWVADPDDEHGASVSLPAAVELRAVQGDYAYGQTVDENSAPVLVRYQIRE